MEHLPSAPGVALQVIMLLTLFMFQHKHLKWGVRQPRQFNHNIFFWYVSPSSLCCAMTVKGQQVRMFSLILIHPNSSCFSVPFKDHLLEQTSFGLSCRMRRNTPSSLQTKHDLQQQRWVSKWQGFGSNQNNDETSAQVKCSGKMERRGALWAGSAEFESQLCHLAACASYLI